MKKHQISNFELKTKLPANHPLPLLDRAATGLLEREAKRLRTLKNSGDLTKYLRAALLQAYYGLSEYAAFADHVRYNSLFRDFIELDSDQDWDADYYEKCHHDWTVNQELRRILLELIESISQLPLPPDDILGFQNCNKIEERLSEWVDRHCPKAVYFQQFRNPPVRRFYAKVHFSDPEPQQELSSLLSDDVSRIIKSAFPLQVEVTGEMGGEDLVFLSDNEEQSLLLNFSRASLSCNPSQFESWEDTVKPYLMPLIDVCKNCDSYLSSTGASLQFGNVIDLPAEVDLSDYFHMLPSPPPLVVPPRLMREENLSYSFPTRMLRSAHRTDLAYDIPGQILTCCYQIHKTYDGYRVELDLESLWTNPFPVDDLPQVFDDLKNNLYMAFHSLITDRTRDLFE